MDNINSTIILHSELNLLETRIVNIKLSRRDKHNTMDKIIYDLIAYSDGGIMSKTVEKTEKMDVTLFCMAKGTDISEHTSRKQGSVYVVEGDGIFNLEGKDIRMLPGTFIYMKEDAVHFIKASENTSFLLSLVSND